MNMNIALGSVSTKALLVDLSKVSDEKRAKILDVLAENEEPAAEPPSQPLSKGGYRSFALTEGQAMALLGAIDARTEKLLRRIAELYDPATGRGTITWLEAREIIFGIPQNAGPDKDAWNKFTKGHRSGLHRSLRHITKEAGVELLISGSNNTYFVDAPAILVLRKIFNIP
jgi:hypothetical protein